MSSSRGALLCFLGLLAALLLVACSTPAKTPGTAQQQLRGLEQSGVIPTLERSSEVGGVDTTGSGVRDDVEEYIERNYSTTEQRSAAMQLARVMQDSLLVDKTDRDAVKAVSVRSSGAVHCVYLWFDDDDGVYPGVVVTDIESISTNTRGRLLAYLECRKVTPVSRKLLWRV